MDLKRIADESKNGVVETKIISMHIVPTEYKIQG